VWVSFTVDSITLNFSMILFKVGSGCDPPSQFVRLKGEWQRDYDAMPFFTLMIVCNRFLIGGEQRDRRLKQHITT
jgi:hypothetical protein